MNDLALGLAVLFSLLALLFALYAAFAAAGFRGALDGMSARMGRLESALTQEAKKRRILKATLLAARDAHAEKLDAHEERFEHLPSNEAIVALVKQHNAMATDLLELKNRVGPLLSGAALRTATGA